MKILIIGENDRAGELVKCISSDFEVTKRKYSDSIDDFEIIFDMNADEENYSFNYQPVNQLLIVSAVKKTLTELSGNLGNFHNMVGMNLLPTLINRELKEVSFLNDKAIAGFDNFVASNKWHYKQVKDSIGMVTPRVLCMIINEAAHTLQEGTASKEDIDKGMILGTNYPLGPLAWCDKIGMSYIVTLLNALFASTGDERYKVCSLLVEMNNKKEKFY